jgi:alkylation response protein AidB-like acyl-CoA dehydrogenase
VRFAFSEDQQELRRATRRFLTTFSSSERVRRAMASELGYERDVWQRLGAELGHTALIVPDAYGGAGFGAVELVAVMEEMGRALLCAPFFSTVCLAEQALLVGGTEAQRQALLPRLAAGELCATLAWLEGSGVHGPDGIFATLQARGDEFLLQGQKSHVVDGHTADLVIVAVRDAGSSGSQGVRLVLVDPQAPGVTRRLLPTLDATRKLAEIALDGVRVSQAALLAGNYGALERTLDLASVALAAEQVGGAERCLEMSIEYAKTRVQFGRPIGSFQAIKHKLADMFLLVESTRSACYFGAWTAATGAADMRAAAAQARTYCSEAYFSIASECIQIHGGIGFTWEHDAHLYFKRAKASEHLLGDPSWQRERYLQALGM